MGIRRELRRINETLDRGEALNRENLERIYREMAEFKREERLRANKVLEPLLASHHDLIAESRAQREALLAILDEMRGGGGHPGGAPA